MSNKSNVRKLSILSSSIHIPLSHRRFQNRAAAVYDMSIDCHDIQTICHIHRLSESIILQDWKGNFDYLQIKLKLNNRKEIEKRFQTIMKEIQQDNIPSTLAAIAHHIPFVYIEEAITDQDITNALNHFLDDFNPKKHRRVEIQEDNLLQKQLNSGQPILTPFEKQLLLEHLIHSLSTDQCHRLIDIKTCLLQYIQSITKINYSTLKSISYLNSIWLRSFLRWASPQINPRHISWLNLNQL